MTRPPRRVMVVGATGAIGQAVCSSLASRGDSIVAVASNSERLNALADGLLAVHSVARVTTMQADLAIEGGPERLVDRALISDPPDDLVLAVGPFYRQTIDSMNRVSLRALFDVHAIGPMLLVQGFAAHLRASHGSVVALTDAGVERPFTGHAAYLAAKAALDCGMRALALELAPSARINVLRLGVVTDPQGATDAARTNRLASRSLTARLGTAEEVASVVLSLLDSTWVCGQVWNVG